MFAEVLLVLEIWMLVSLLVAWLLCRCALLLRGQPRTLGELMRERAHLDAVAPRLDAPLDPGSLMRAVRIYERV